MAAARRCDECATFHAVRHNEVWFEAASAGESVGGDGGRPDDVGEGWPGVCWVPCWRWGPGASSPRSSPCFLPRPACPLAPARAGWMRRTIQMFCCYKGVVYDMT